MRSEINALVADDNQMPFSMLEKRQEVETPTLFATHLDTTSDCSVVNASCSQISEFQKNHQTLEQKRELKEQTYNFF